MRYPGEEIITSRRSVRAFLPTPVARETVEHILAVASRAPSGTNTQPWKVRVLAGAAKERLCDAVTHAFDTEPEKHSYSYRYYPADIPEPYLSRRRKVGWDLYGLLGIKKGDRERTRRQHRRNYRFFDAPVGLIFTIDKVLEQGSWIDYGMFLQNVMSAARAAGLHTCPQAAWVQFHKVVAEVLQIPESEEIVCGMALGHEDPDAPENRLRTQREPVSGFARFEGFED
ncbi:MAG: nitroreductase [Methyloligellaceae bacterium]